MDVAMVSSVSVRGVFNGRQQSIGDMLGKMQSSIEDAADAGKVDKSLAEALMKKLDEIKKVIDQNATSDLLSSNDRQKIRKNVNELGKALFAAMHQQSAAQSSSGSAIDELFKALDANSDGKVEKNELSQFVGATSSPVQDNGSPFKNAGMYGRQGSMSISMLSVSQTRFSMIA